MITIEQYNEIQAYKKEGKTRVEVASLMGLNRDTVGSWWNKEYTEHHTTEGKKAHAKIERERTKKEKFTTFTWSFAESYNRGLEY